MIAKMENTRRANILEQAKKLFLKNGYHNVSLQDIATASGIQKSTLYHYFSSRQMLMDAILIDIYERFEIAFFKACTDHKASLDVGQVTTRLQEWFADQDYNCLLIQLAYQLSDVEHDIRASLQNFFKTCHNSILSILPPEDTEADYHRAHQILAQIIGSVFLAHQFSNNTIVTKSLSSISKDLESTLSES